MKTTRKPPKNKDSPAEGTANFEVMREWNRAMIYRQTIVHFAERLQGR